MSKHAIMTALTMASMFNTVPDGPHYGRRTKAKIQPTRRKSDPIKKKARKASQKSRRKNR